MAEERKERNRKHGSKTFISLLQKHPIFFSFVALGPHTYTQTYHGPPSIQTQSQSPSSSMVWSACRLVMFREFLLQVRGSLPLLQPTLVCISSRKFSTKCPLKSLLLLTPLHSHHLSFPKALGQSIKEYVGCLVFSYQKIK